MRSGLAAVLAAALLHAIPAGAADQPWNAKPFGGDPKAIIAAAATVPAGESDVVVLLDELSYTFDDQGRATNTWRFLFRVVDESALDDWSTVEADWSPWYQERPRIEARVIAKDGSVHLVDPGAVTESGSSDDSEDIFTDERVLRAPLPAMAAGVVVEQVITYRDRNPLFDTGTTSLMTFGRSAPVERTRLVIDAPAALHVRFVNKTSPRIEPLTTEADGRRKVVFEMGRTEPLDDLEWNLPYDESSLPYVAFSTGASWQDVARRYTELVEKQLADQAAVETFVRNAIGSSKDRREVVAKALSAIQKNVRYAGVEVGDGSIVPRTPKTVLAQKYGDCKDKATLLVAMLRACGIPANVALLSAGTDLDVDPELPGLGRFNHVIVRVGGEDPFWVDPTDEYSPAGVLPVVDQDRLVLVADAATTGLVRTPAAESSANFTRETRTFILAEEGKASVTEVTECRGSDDSSIRRAVAETEKKQYRESMESYAKNAYDAESLEDLSHTDPRDLSTPFRLTLEMAKVERGQTGDIDAGVGIPRGVLVQSLPWELRNDDDPEESEADEPAKPRTRDFVIPDPFVKELVYRIVPPPGFAARTLPQDEARKLGTASLSTKYEVAADGAVLATLRFDSGKRRLTPSEMDETRKAVTAFANSDAIIVGFDSVGWARLNAGDVRGGIAEFRRLAALHPTEARHHVQVARAYFAGGMAEVARDEFRRAIALEPSYAPAWRFLGVTLQHDLLGRELRKGFDLPGAIAAYRKAKELAPKDVEIRGELAKLLARGTDGELYGEGANLTAAIAEYKAVAADLKDDRYEGELLTAMAHAGLFEEMKTRAREVKNADARLTALVIAAAATAGMDAALREAATVDTTARRRILGAAYPTLLQLRLYPEAAAALDQAAQGTPNAAQVAPIIDVLRRTKRFEQLQLGSDARSVVTRVGFLSSSAADTETAVRPYVASWLWKFEDDLKDRRKKSGSEREDRATQARTKLKAQAQGLPLDVAAEIGISVMDFSDEGNDATGHRVRMRPRFALPNAPGVKGETFYVTKEAGKYVVGAVSLASVGVSALHFADSGELEAARTWLNWAREEVSAGDGDDPLFGSTFAALWPKGKSAATAEEVRAAAAALLVLDRDYAAGAVPRLIAARETVPEAMRLRVDVALALAYAQAEEYERMAEVTQRLVDAAPSSPRAFAVHMTALIEGGRGEEAKKLATKRLESIPDDPDALRALAEASSAAGDFAGANGYVRRIIERSDAPAEDYNTIAWNSLFIGKGFEQAIEDVNRALSIASDPAILHTLAALYAEAGRSMEARTKLLESMELGGRDEPSTADWYVLGRIAENYGATDAALAAYRRVTAPRRNRSTSSYELAQRRVVAIGRK